MTTGANLGNRLPTKQRKESKAVVHPNMSINITEEALKRGKLPIEVVAKNVLQNKYNSNDTIEDITNVTVEPSQTISANHDALFSSMSSLQ